MSNQRNPSKAASPSPHLHEAVEIDLDANYHRVAIAHSNRTVATWYLLTVIEDSFRGLFVLTEDSHAPVVEFQLDSQKYSVRFALDRIRKESTNTSNAAIPLRVIAKLYIKTAELLRAGVDFKAANQLCSAAHAGTVTFVEGDNTIDIVFDEIQHDKRYAALELLGHTPLDVIDHALNLYAWARRRPCAAADRLFSWKAFSTLPRCGTLPIGANRCAGFLTRMCISASFHRKCL